MRRGSFLSGECTLFTRTVSRWEADPSALRWEKQTPPFLF